MSMTVDHLLAYINERHGTGFRLRGRYTLGENQGAYAVADARGAPFVLKWDRRPERLPRLERARRITDRLRDLGAPVPTYSLARALPDGHTYWLQTALPGAPPTTLTDRRLQQLLELNELQAGQAVSTEQDWAAYVAAVVFAGESGWADALRHHSLATRGVLDRLERLVAGKQACCVNRGDIVHGDLCLDNILVDGDHITGIVDWDAAGCGDRVLDLTKLLYYSYDNAPVRSRLRERIIDLVGPDTLCVYAAYAILAQLDWSIGHHPQAAVDAFVERSHTILQDLEAL